MGLLNAESWWSPCSVSPLISDPVVAVLWIYPCPVAAQLFRVVQMSPCEETGVSGHLDWSVLFFPPHAQQAASIPGVFWTFSLLRQFYTRSIIPEQQTNFPEFSNGNSSSKSKLHHKGTMSFFC